MYAAIIIAVGGYVWHCEYVKNDYKDFVATLKADAKLAEKVTQIQTDKDKQRKEKADEEGKRLAGDNKRLARELRVERSRRSFLSAPAAGSPSPERATVNRSEFERTMAYLDERGSGIVEQGDDYRIGLDVAKRWAQ